MALIQFSTPDLPDNDGFYHIRIAEIMRQEGFKPDFPWLPLSILNAREYADHHFLFHVALIPFTFGDLRLGAKWAAVVFSALAFLSVWWLLRRQSVPYAALCASVLAISEAFLYRMSMHCTIMSLAFLIMGCTGCLRQYRWLIVILSRSFMMLFI
jgi:asparagine N-glycosylation enzyme membrane subunit Stt3